MQLILQYVCRQRWQKTPLNLVSTLVVVFICLSSHSHAQVYGGFIAGKSTATNNGDIDDSLFPPIEDSTGYKVSIGNALSPVFAYEFSYVDLGDYIVGDAEGAAVDPTEQSDQISITGVDASIVGNFAMTRQLVFYTKLGYMFWFGERTIERIDTTTSARTVDISEYDEQDISTGLGIRYDFSRSVRFNIEANAYKTDDVFNILYGAGFFVTF